MWVFEGKKKTENEASIIMVKSIKNHFFQSFPRGQDSKKIWESGHFAGIFLILFSKIHQIMKQKN